MSGCGLSEGVEGGYGFRVIPVSLRWMLPYTAEFLGAATRAIYSARAAGF